MSLTHSDTHIHHQIKMLIAEHGDTMSPATRAALDNVIHTTTPPRLNLEPMDTQTFSKINRLLHAAISWRGWVPNDRALMVDMQRQADHLERRRVARQADLAGER